MNFSSISAPTQEHDMLKLVFHIVYFSLLYCCFLLQFSSFLLNFSVMSAVFTRGFHGAYRVDYHCLIKTLTISLFLQK